MSEEQLAGDNTGLSSAWAALSYSYCCHELTRNGMLWAAQSNTELTQTRCHCTQGKAIGWSVSLT